MGHTVILTGGADFCEAAAVPLRRRPETVADRIDQLMVTVFIADERERNQRLAEHLAPDFVYVNPRAVFEGASGLSDAYSRFRHDGWLRMSLHFRYAWERLEGEQMVMKGWCFGWVDAEGKISRIVSFNDPVPDRVS
jgi:hypothetical protein